MGANDGTTVLYTVHCNRAVHTPKLQAERAAMTMADDAYNKTYHRPGARTSSCVCMKHGNAHELKPCLFLSITGALNQSHYNQRHGAFESCEREQLQAR